MVVICVFFVVFYVVLCVSMCLLWLFYVCAMCCPCCSMYKVRQDYIRLYKFISAHLGIQACLRNCQNGIVQKVENMSKLVDLGGLGPSRRRHRLRHVEIDRMVYMTMSENIANAILRTNNVVFNMFGRSPRKLLVGENAFRSQILFKISRVRGIRPDFEKSALPPNPYIRISGNRHI